jgi:hypothetical protein
MDNNLPPQPLTHDEQKAAEAAFAGRPFNPRWSASARRVYDGLQRALPTPPVPDEEPAALEPAGDPIEAAQTEPVAHGPTADDHSEEELSKDTVPAKIPFRQAIETGALIDVTPTAKQLGLAFPVTITKPLWEVGIAPTKTLTEDERAARLRDVLMAFRLRLATQPTISPLIDFPALLAFPPDAAPQPIPLFALIQPDEQNRTMVTLLLPNEVAATIIPMN